MPDFGLIMYLGWIVLLWLVIRCAVPVIGLSFS